MFLQRPVRRRTRSPLWSCPRNSRCTCGSHSSDMATSASRMPLTRGSSVLSWATASDIWIMVCTAALWSPVKLPFLSWSGQSSVRMIPRKSRGRCCLWKEREIERSEGFVRKERGQLAGCFVRAGKPQRNRTWSRYMMAHVDRAPYSCI